MRISMRLAILASAALLSSGAAQAQQAPQSPDMTFFVTSVGSGKGADLGGLEGADRHCQTLAQGAGAGNKTWRAYLSTTEPGGSRSRARWHAYEKAEVYTSSGPPGNDATMSAFRISSARVIDTPTV